MGRWLITGGAGYIGSHVVRNLIETGLEPVVFDDLSTGDPARVDVPVVFGSLNDLEAIQRTLASERFEGVVHLAASKRVDESMRAPLMYYRRNVGGLVNLLTAMSDARTERLIYSSSASVYGTPQNELVDEDAATVPENPYGESKLVGEWLVRRQSQAAGLRYAALRYFNVAGARSPRLADRAGANLIPLVLTALAAGVAPRIFGDDFATEDGTCVRDFVHVDDLARAHVDAIRLLESPDAAHVLNVGTGVGYSVRQVVDQAVAVTGRVIRPVVEGRRPGDPARVVADAARLRAATGWRPTHSLTEMIASTWQAMATIGPKI